LAIQQAAQEAADAQAAADEQAYEEAQAEEQAAIDAAAQQAAADQAAEDAAAAAQAQAQGTDNSPFPTGDLPVKSANLIGRRFFSPMNHDAHGNYAYLKFTSSGGMLFVSEYRNAKAVQPYVKLNCGPIANLDGATGGFNCSINPYGLEGTRSGSANLNLAIYIDGRGKTAVAPLFDYEITDWQNYGAALRFHDWSQK
jgi:hypothetical protein